VTDRLGRLLLVTLEAVRINADLPVLGALRSWLDSWRGIGDVERGMERQGFDLQLTRYDEKGWRATFYTSGMEHSITSATPSAWERTPWHAVQGAAREALKNRVSDDTLSAPEILALQRIRRRRCLLFGLFFGFAPAELLVWSATGSDGAALFLCCLWGAASPSPTNRLRFFRPSPTAMIAAISA